MFYKESENLILVKGTLIKYLKDNSLDIEIDNTEALVNNGIYPLTIGNRPDFDKSLQKIRLGTPIEVSGSNPKSFTVNWTISNMTESEKSAYDNNLLKLAAFARKKRNTALSETDYWELPSQAPISAERETYRQALRDITDQEGFPQRISWPAKP